MNPEDAMVLESLLRSAFGHLKTAGRDVGLALDLLAERSGRGSAAGGPRRQASDLVDEGRFVVRWNGRECALGHTLQFRLFRRLALSLNGYVEFENLVHDVWGGEPSGSAVKSAVRDLRRKLVADGMGDLADAIDGGNAGHYGLRLDRLSPARGRHQDPTQTPP